MSLTGKNITVLTGAGISSESGIPTFRGPEGYWTIGSVNYHPQEMATHAMFSSQPNEVWKWYLNRLSTCGNAMPNDGHLALVEMENLLQHRFCLITQNVDNLHLRAGNTLERTLQIHGNILFMRCSRDCRGLIYPLPAGMMPRDSHKDLSPEEKQKLSCPNCSAVSRPHVLWFDESYDEHYFKFQSALNVANETDVLIIAGTSGSTTLPNLIVNTVFQNDGTIIDINIDENPFTELAINSRGGKFMKTTCSKGLRSVVDLIRQDGI